MELKDYQEAVLSTLNGYLEELFRQKENAFEVMKLISANPKLKIDVPDYCSDTWNKLKHNSLLPSIRKNIPYSPRVDGTGKYVPDICLKIPTGGGKTLLATASVSRIFGCYLFSNTGMVLWIMPNEAIFTQTKKYLMDRYHPYRQMLDRAAAGKVKILEKDDSLNKQDVDSHLCIMLLMLQSANRETKETLRLFRDRGNVHGFFPSEDDFQAHYDLLQSIPNLSTYNSRKRNFQSIIHDSLGNVLRLIHPVVVIDEGHKAFSKKALDTIYGFNPSVVLELSATPKDRIVDKPPTYANWLVDVRGSELAKEDMIKLPINVKVKAGNDWRNCLRESLECLNKLQAESEKLYSNTAIYIRPILLVQVERTGREQRDAGFIHADDARKFLLSAGFKNNEIAIKTSDRNDLSAPENQDLLSQKNTIRAIITKQALQEGWDCPFAYILCSLSASRNLSSMTQLVGRILRQPYALKTKIESLNQCYVFCHHISTKEVVEGIKSSLERDGMADLVQEIRELGVLDDGKTKKSKISRRKKFKDLQIFLPVVNIVVDGKVRALDYENDILMKIEWDKIDLLSLVKSIPDNITLIKSQIAQITVSNDSGEEFFPVTKSKTLDEGGQFDPVYATRIISDIIPNPWVARQVISKLVKTLLANKFDHKRIDEQSSFIIEELRKYLTCERDKLAEELFIADVQKQLIQFKLRTDTHNWQMPDHMWTDLPENSPKLINSIGDGVQKSLFAPVYKEEFNNDEEGFACYLDAHAALIWWHRNVAKSGQYFIQGWRRNKVYPDFIFAQNKGKIVVIETKGDQLAGNLDTEYKRKLLGIVNDHFALDKAIKAGAMELVLDDNTRVSCDLLLMSEWKTKIHNHL